ncbi:GNAT family N-acetyltransferase [Chitinimonas lacunae]|uniref:GNAT family N-acetyltransferase n=1 Tax=Chitinimonas lacunae TaxID=1963018 RepID=A0ABV8MTD0_9NEIS
MTTTVSLDRLVECVVPDRFNHLLPGLVDLLRQTVAQGASVGFLAPLAEVEAAAYWRGVLHGLVEGERWLWVAWEGAKLQGAVQLEPCRRSNGRHRAEVQKLMVQPDCRGRGIGRMLMSTLEHHALAQSISLLVLDTSAGSVAEPFYRANGYTFVGGIPDYAADPDGTLRANAIYYKPLRRD